MNLMRSTIFRFIFSIYICSGRGIIAFSTSSCRSSLPLFRKSSITTCQANWLGDLWDEVIEFSTYGPAERKLLKAKREKDAAAAVAAANQKEDGDVSVNSFQRAQQKYGSNNSNDNIIDDYSSSPSTIEEDSLSLQNFQSAVAVSNKYKDEDIDFDGYKLRDLIVEKWGVPLDVDFQRGSGGRSVYCAVLPVVAFGSKRCRHESELDYLMHLQGVIEILQKYNNLDQFIFFLQKTSRAPKPGVESAPYLMDLDNDSLKQIL